MIKITKKRINFGRLTDKRKKIKKEYENMLRDGAVTKEEYDEKVKEFDREIDEATRDIQRIEDALYEIKIQVEGFQGQIDVFLDKVKENPEVAQVATELKEKKHKEKLEQYKKAKKRAEDKKEIIEKIKKIDDILNNDIKLKKEFIKRNEVLDMNHRIFSLSDLSEILENERKELIDNLNKCSKKMEPLNFIKTKTEIENKLVLLKELELEKQNKEILSTKVNELLNLVCKAIKIQIDNAEEKEEIIRLVYVIRYFGLIYISEKEQVKDKIDINLIQKLIITKACKQRIITIFSKNIKENYTIIKNILQTDIIELEKMYLRFNTKTNKTILEIYDEENMYNTLEIPNIEEPNVKQNKKIKVFI